MQDEVKGDPRSQIQGNRVNSMRNCRMKRHGGNRKYDTTTISCEALPPSDMIVIRRCLQEY